MALFTDSDYEILPTFLSADETLALKLEAQSLLQSGQFRPAKMGKDRLMVPERRGDQICWWDPVQPTAVQNIYLKRINELRETLNRTLYLGLNDWEGHYAFYPPGTRYEKHVDRFHTDDKRVLSTVLYLNEDWNELWGGELVLYLNEPRHILPRGGTLALFLSDKIPHEVREASQSRWSIAGWFRRRN